ncbi:hypothetical protein A4A49_02535 [Nicotiana attenuata]|uniref:Uncharacterized protein n=1 Tax=Nicotiana attenuata TaxID=49451 RepID=A0A314KH44_NICAT|nr:hypothetical protein A4A49_55580 [Nicotiana attenuata]OIT35429.1 hypothetical protein A4A49_02535 [Nicotiana attenuata]
MIREAIALSGKAKVVGVEVGRGKGTGMDSNFLGLTAIVTLGYQFIFFVITALLKFDKVTDLAGSTNLIILAILTLVLKGSWYFRQKIWHLDTCM